jgi:CheY-like chemotaxis protein
MSRTRVLVVDDEELNLLIIQEFLEQEELELDFFADPLAAWDSLQQVGSGYSLVILDRMMPRLDGMEFLRRLKSSGGFHDIPVIMQTAAASPDQVRQGLEAGAYYYLTKPYEPEALISIVRAALEDLRTRQQLSQRALCVEESQKLLVNAEYQFRTLDDISLLVPVLAKLCPVPDAVAPGLSDLMVNAVEHGNLCVTYQEKASLKWEGDWEGEINRRLALPEYRDRVATIRIERGATFALRLTITDQGAGFEWQRFLDFDPERAYDPNGRGIAMAKMLSFSAIEYQGKGNVVIATVALPDSPNA